MSNDNADNDSSGSPDFLRLETSGDYYARRRGSENQAANFFIQLVGFMILIGFLISSCRDSFERRKKERMEKERQQELENPVEPTWGK